MDIKKIAYILFAIGLVLIISGSFSSFLDSLKKDREMVERRMEDVTSIYETFSTKVSLYGDYREDFHESIMENLYYETMYSTDELVKSELKKYEGMVDDITKDAQNLDGLCRNVYYPEGSINSMCINYPVMYEQVMNYFVLDIEEYNNIVKQFNDYQKLNNRTDYVQEYTIMKDFIDYNGDKLFEGKEE